MPSKQPTEKCRIFVSRKKSDRSVFGEHIQKKLMKFAPNRLDFFDDTDIKPGDTWREEIRRELDKANILVLVLTKPAADDFDWPLYEAGLFEDLSEASRKRVVCLHPVGVPRPSQLEERQAVEANKDEVFDLLAGLYRDKEFTNTKEALNLEVEDDDLQPIVDDICRLINRGEGSELKKVDHGNRWLELVFRKGVDSLEPEVEVISGERSLGDLFNLPAQPVRAEYFNWGDIAEHAKLEGDEQGFNLLWIEELGQEIAARRNPDRQAAKGQLTGRYLGKDGKLYRPEIEMWQEFADGTLKLVLTFSEQVHESWLKPTPLVALAAMINLASRIRHELIEPHLKILAQWKLRGGDEAEFAKISGLKKKFERSGFFIDRLTKESFLAVFDEHQEQAAKLGALYEEFQSKIEPDLSKAVEAFDTELARNALEAWKKNNGRFLKIGLDVYASELGLEDAA